MLEASSQNTMCLSSTFSVVRSFTLASSPAASCGSRPSKPLRHRCVTDQWDPGSRWYDKDGHIIFCEDASNIVSHPSKSKKTSVPILSVRIGDHCYYGLCDIGASSSAIPYELYKEIMHEIGPCELEEIDVAIQLANRETIFPIGIVRDVEVLCGKIKYPADFLVLGTAASKTCPIIFRSEERRVGKECRL